MVPSIYQDVFLVGTSMGAAVIWSYIENYRTSRLSGAVFVDQAPLQVSMDPPHRP